MSRFYFEKKKSCMRVPTQDLKIKYKETHFILNAYFVIS